MIVRAVCFALLMTAWPAMAQTIFPTNESTVARVNAGVVGIVSGGVDGTYIRIASDLAAVLDDGDRLRVIAMIGKGSVGNISDIMYLRGTDVGIVQSDALAYVQRQKLYAGSTQTIQYIAKLYDEELHILARKDIVLLQDLAGQAVNIDVRGSGTTMTASVVFDSLHIAVKTTNDDQNTALEKLKNGEIAAIVYVAGKPTRLFAGVAGNGLHFLPVPLSQALLETYLPSSLRHSDYPSLVAEGSDIETIAVGSVMAVYAWPPNSDRYRKVARFTEAFFDKFSLFLQPPRHPKWGEVNLAAQVPGWTRFPAAQEWLQAQSAGGPDGVPKNDLNTFLAQSGGSRATMTEIERIALFKEFVAWQHRKPVTR
jgi:uncharacterized protein